MIVSQPGIYSFYPSSMVSKYYVWFMELDYPQLDIAEYSDGSWDIIQYLNSPVIPSLTRHQLVLGNMKNILITPGFVEKYVKQLDTSRKEFWDREEAKTRAVAEEHERVQRHKHEFVDTAHKAITSNPDLMERIAKKGFKEMDLDNIRKHVPKSKL